MAAEKEHKLNTSPSEVQFCLVEAEMERTGTDEKAMTEDSERAPCGCCQAGVYFTSFFIFLCVLYLRFYNCILERPKDVGILRWYFRNFL